MPWKLREMICEQCNGIYNGIPGRKYCSYKCAKESRKRRLDKKCNYCGKQYWIQKWQENSNKFCSVGCAYSANSNPIETRNCTNCGIEIKRKSQRFKGKNYFCTHKCATDFLRGENHYEWREIKRISHPKDKMRKWS